MEGGYGRDLRSSILMHSFGVEVAGNYYPVPLFLFTFSLAASSRCSVEDMLTAVDNDIC